MIKKNSPDTYKMTIPRLDVVYTNDEISVTVTRDTMEYLYQSMREVLLFGEDEG